MEITATPVLVHRRVRRTGKCRPMVQELHAARARLGVIHAHAEAPRGLADSVRRYVE